MLFRSVVPIFKSGDICDINNYRPVSILPILSKIIERHVHNSLLDYLDTHNLIYSYQSGFRPLHSCETALNHMIDNWMRSMDAGKFTGLLYIDLRKAFDTVNHPILLNKLAAYGIHNVQLTWFKDYLSNRKQATYWQGELSDFGTVTVGVPQGSILGPLLFILYINDLPKCLKHSQIHMYADDSTQEVIGQTINEVENKLNEDFEQVALWMANHKLTLHVGKTKAQLIGTTRKVNSNTQLKITYQGKAVEQVSQAKLLGVQIDSNLTWAAQHDSVCKKVSQRIGILKRIRNLLPVNVACQLYNALILPHLDFCCTVWGSPGNKFHTERITKLQKRAARIILQCGTQDYSSAELFKMLKWMPFQERVNFKTCILMFKSLNGLSPSYLQNFYYVSEQHSYNTRSAARNLLCTTKASLSILTRSFKYRGERLWNNLPTVVRSSPSLKHFKQQYCKHFNV